jgi:acid phosphatase type 7
MLKKSLLNILFALPALLFSQNLLRGPYLQSMTNNSVVVMWRTDVPSNSVVKVGTSPDNLTEVFSSADLVIDHNIAIEGLSPRTTYYYSVSSNDVLLAGTDEWHHFKTAPNQGSREKMRMWVLGDFGKKTIGQIAAKQAFVEYTKDAPADFKLWLGDNCYDDGKDEEYQERVFSRDYGYDSIFRYLPFYPLPGNHDYNSVTQINAHNHKGPYFDMIEVFKNGEFGGHPSGTKNYYSFNWGNAHFIQFNSEIWGDVLFPAQNPRMRNWLKKDLELNTQEWTIVSFHQPPYSKGSHDSDDFYELVMAGMKNNYGPIFEQYGVDLVLCGHSHVYERSFMLKGFHGALSSHSRDFRPEIHAVQYRPGNPDIDGPYIKYLDGDSANIGTVYVVSGNGGQSKDGASLDHPVMAAADGGRDVCGSVIIDIEGSRLEGRYLKSDGTIGDYFAIEKRLTNPTSVNDLSANFNYLRIYPNPVTDKLYIEWSLKDPQTLVISLFDMTGRKVARLGGNKYTRGEHTITVDLKSLSLPTGQYMINFRTTDGRTLNRSLVKIGE